MREFRAALGGALRGVRVVLLFVLTGLAIVPLSAQAASPPLLRKFCPTGSAAGQCSIPRGIGVDGTSGDVYVADQNNFRVEKFSPWGEQIGTWGEEGSGRGQFGILGPQGVAVDSAGDVYVIDWSNRRVQKFGSEGEFLLMFGGEVNQTKVEEAGSAEGERNLCPVAPGDVCHAGIEGAGKGQFGAWVLGSYIAVDRKGTATAADDVVYVGDQGRVQEFDSEGHYLDDLPDPDKVLEEEGTVNSLAVDPVDGSLYLGFFPAGFPPRSKPDLHKLNPAGEEECTIAAHDPTAVAVGPGGEVYVVDGVAPGVPREIVRFDSKCGSKNLLFSKELISTEGENQFSIGAGETNPTGVATSAAACGIKGVDLFFANPDQENSFIKLFGPPPDGKICPPPKVPPSIDDQFAASVGMQGATVRARINPHFWPGTTYYVQYGTAECLQGGWEAPCVKEQPAKPGSVLSEETLDADVTTKGILLGATEALAPDTEYRYRFVARTVFGPNSGEDAEVRGVGGKVGIDGEDGAFHTFPSSAPPDEGCPNQSFRSGASAHLPDCRAYELVSPVDKNNGDVARPHLEIFDQSAADGDGLTFAAFNAFAEPEAAPLYSQYIAQRDPEEGWSSRSINVPRSGVGLVFQENLVTRYKAFDEDLCSGWLFQDTDVPLVEGAVPRGFANLYRNRGLRSGCGPAGYQLLTTVSPPGYEPKAEKGGSDYYPQIQGFSADGATSVFRVGAVLNGEACDSPEGGKGVFQVYLSREGAPGIPPKLVSVLPGGEAACTHSSVGTSQALSVLVNTREDSVYHAVSADGSRVYWTATSSPVTHINQTQSGNEPGKIYLRLNSTRAQSTLAHGSATGTGDLIGPAEGPGRTAKSSEIVKQVEPAEGAFAVGQEISDAENNIPTGTKIVAIEEEPLTKKEEEEGKKKSGKFKLTISAKATGTKVGDELKGAASETIFNVIAGDGAFEVGQSISGAGIPFGATVEACSPSCGSAATSLTLSAKATQSKTGAALTAISDCTEPEAACTLPVSAEAEALSGANASLYLAAAADGSAAIFESGQVSEQGAFTGEDLYEFDLAKALAHEPATHLIAHESAGILGVSDDASHTYFTSSEKLEEGATAGSPNLYLYRRGAGVSFIATLGAVDVSHGVNGFPSAVNAFPYRHVARVSPDGLHAVFGSTDPQLAESVAHYDNLDASSGRPDREIYLYNAAPGGGGGGLVCVSCNPSGARPAGREAIQGTNGAPGIWAAAGIPGWTNAMHPGNVLSADGGRLFFESFEPLVPRDINGLGDVYEWERAANKEACLGGIGGELYVASSGGCLSLISSGQGSTDAEFVDASTNGRDVFFFTNVSLLPQDPDFQDIYDAREGGGFPPPSMQEPECEGDACQNPAVPPGESAPASSVPKRPGNLAPTGLRCAKSKRRVVAHGKARCLPKHRRHHRRRAAR